MISGDLSLLKVKREKRATSAIPQKKECPSVLNDMRIKKFSFWVNITFILHTGDIV